MLASILTDPSNPLMPILVIGGAIALWFLLGFAAYCVCTAAARGDSIADQQHEERLREAALATCFCGRYQCQRHTVVPIVRSRQAPH